MIWIIYIYSAFGSYIRTLDHIFKVWIIYSNFGLYIQSLDHIFELWIIYSKFGSFIRTLDHIFKVWTIYSNFEPYIQSLNHIFGALVEILFLIANFALTLADIFNSPRIPHPIFTPIYICPHLKPNFLHSTPPSMQIKLIFHS